MKESVLNRGQSQDSLAQDWSGPSSESTSTHEFEVSEEYEETELVSKTYLIWFLVKSYIF
jgi:hypothetical protein